jgi:2-polyprenyl-6-methoxyphenol hydroxylase-like FAD-dependent oxidoreductase
MVTLAGAVGDYPPTDLDSWRKYAGDLPTRDVADMVRDREPIGDIVAYRYPANRRRHYDKMKRFPDGFLVIGDAICSFNPVYGQGMSVAATEAKALDDCLAAGDSDLWKRFFKRAHAITESPWVIATGEDMKYPQVEGKRPPGFKLVNKYMERVHKAATKDPVVLKQFFLVANLLAAPTSVMAPKIAWRVLLGGRGQAQALPLKAGTKVEAREPAGVR